MTDAELHHKHTMLELAADRLEDDIEYTIRMGVGTGSMQRLRELRKAANEAREVADNFYEKNQTAIQRHLDWCQGKEICK